MAQLDPSMIGLLVTGDIGDVTIYTDRWGRKIAFDKAPPLEPPSAIQLWQWQRWRSAIDAWRSLAPDQKLAYSAAARRVKALANGPSLWIYLCFRQDHGEWKTICRVTRISLVQPPLV